MDHRDITQGLSFTHMFYGKLRLVADYVALADVKFLAGPGRFLPVTAANTRSQAMHATIHRPTRFALYTAAMGHEVP